MTTIDIIKSAIASTPYEKSKKQFVNRLYWKLVAMGHKPYIFNELYIGLGAEEFQFTHNRKDGIYTAKPLPTSYYSQFKF